MRSRALLATSLAVALVAACGSDSDDSHGGDDGGDGGTAQGGTSGSGAAGRSGGGAGRSAAGASSMAGRVAGGGANAGSGAGGTAGGAAGSAVSGGSAGTLGGSGGSTGGSAGLGGTAGEPPTPTCAQPGRIAAPGSDKYQIYDSAIAYSPGVGIGVLWSSWPQGAEPYFALFDPVTQSFGTTKRMTTPIGYNPYSSRDIDLAVLPDGGFVAAWLSQGNSYTTFALHPEADGDPEPHNMGASIRDAGPTVATAPFFDGKVAVAYTDLVGASNDLYQARVGIHDPAEVTHEYYDIAVPGDRDPAVQLLRAEDRLLVLLTAKTSDASSQYYDLYLATIQADDPFGMVGVTPLLEHASVYTPPLALIEGGFMVAYQNDEYTPLLGRFDLDGTPLGAPIPVVTDPLALRIDALLVDSAGNGMLFTEPELILHYSALDASYQPAAPSAVLAVRDDIPHGVSLLHTGSGLFAGWHAAMGNVYVSPLCDDSSGEAGAGSVGSAGEAAH